MQKKKDTFIDKCNNILENVPAEQITPQMGWLYMRIFQLLNKNFWHPISISDSRLAKMCNLSRNTIGKLRQQLQDLGLIKFTLLKSRGIQSAVQYEIPENFTSTAPQKNSKIMGEKGLTELQRTEQFDALKLTGNCTNSYILENAPKKESLIAVQFNASKLTRNCSENYILSTFPPYNIDIKTYKTYKTTTTTNACENFVVVADAKSNETLGYEKELNPPQIDTPKSEPAEVVETVEVEEVIPSTAIENVAIVISDKTATLNTSASDKNPYMAQVEEFHKSSDDVKLQAEATMNGYLTQSQAIYEPLLMRNMISFADLQTICLEVVNDWCLKGVQHKDFRGNFDLYTAMNHLHNAVEKKLSKRRDQKIKSASRSRTREEADMELMQHAMRGIAQAIAHDRDPNYVPPVDNFEMPF